MKLAVNLITRNRPDVLVRTLNRTLPNISSGETLFMVSADDDDGPTCDALRAFENRCVVSILPREDDLGSKYNRMLKYEADVYRNLSDYTSIVRPGFDRHILWAAEMFPDGIGMVCNRLRNASFPDLFALTKPLVDRLGFYFPPYFTFWFVDHWVDDISKLIDRVIMAEADVEYDDGKKSATQNLRDLHFWTTFFDAAHLRRRRVAHAIVDDLDEPEWRKAMIKSRAPLIEFRSKWINDTVRGAAPHLEQGAKANAQLPDERYLRVKARAMAVLRDEFLPELKAAELKAAA